MTPSILDENDNNLTEPRCDVVSWWTASLVTISAIYAPALFDLIIMSGYGRESDVLSFLPLWPAMPVYVACAGMAPNKPVRVFVVSIVAAVAMITVLLRLARLGRTPLVVVGTVTAIYSSLIACFAQLLIASADC
jgi:hypothetical protein